MTSENPPRVLIIDNDESVALAISTRLQSLGYHCTTACDGAQGVSEFQARPFDLVITDLNMPAGDGIALASSLRRISEVPIIIVTGFRDEFRDRLRGLRNVTVMPKPFDSNALIELVETELALRTPPS